MKMRHRILAIVILLIGLVSLAQETQPMPPDAIDQQLRLLQESNRASVRRQATLRLRGQLGREINEAMLLAIGDADPAVRTNALYHLRDARWPVPPAALKRAAQDRNSNVRAAAIWTLMTLYPAQHIGTVSEALGDSAPGVRTAAIWAAGEFARAFEPELSTLVVKLFNGCFSKECNAITWVLLKHGGRLPDSVRSRLVDKHSAVRAVAAQAIGKSAAYAELATIQALAVDPIPWVRAAAASGLGALAGGSNDSNTRELLLGLLGDENSHVRLAAAEALENVGFVGIEHLIDYVEGRTDEISVIAELDQASIAPIVMELWEILQGGERRRLAHVLMGWHYEPAVEAGVALVASRSLLDRMTGWRGLIGYWKLPYLGRAALATLTSPFTWLYVLLIAAIVTWAIWTRNNLRGVFSKDDA